MYNNWLRCVLFHFSVRVLCKYRNTSSRPHVQEDYVNMHSDAKRESVTISKKNLPHATSSSEQHYVNSLNSLVKPTSVTDLYENVEKDEQVYESIDKIWALM